MDLKIKYGELDKEMRYSNFTISYNAIAIYWERGIYKNFTVHLQQKTIWYYNIELELQ